VYLNLYVWNNSKVLLCFNHKPTPFSYATKLKYLFPFSVEILSVLLFLYSSVLK
jgi:hypothetical protein